MAVSGNVSNAKTLETETLLSRDFFDHLIDKKMDISHLFISNVQNDQDYEYEEIFTYLTSSDDLRDELIYIAYNKYLASFRVTPDKTSSLVSLSFKHRSPIVSYHWLSNIIEELNIYLAKKTNDKALLSINF